MLSKEVPVFFGTYVYTNDRGVVRRIRAREVREGAAVAASLSLFFGIDVEWQPA